MKKINGVDWDEKGLVMTKNNIGNVFLLGAANYPNANGEMIAVFFTSERAFFFVDEQGNWSMKELRDEYVAKDSALRYGDFPIDFDGYREICVASNDDGEDFVGDVNMDMLSTFGIGTAEVAEDIQKRLKSLANFRVEVDMLKQ